MLTVRRVLNFPLQRGYRVAVEGDRVVKHAVKKREAETSQESSSRLRQNISPKLLKVSEFLAIPFFYSF